MKKTITVPKRLVGQSTLVTMTYKAIISRIEELGVNKMLRSNVHVDGVSNYNVDLCVSTLIEEGYVKSLGEDKIALVAWEQDIS